MTSSSIAIRCALAATFALLTGSALAQGVYPSKAIRFILPNAAGGSTSVVARLIGEKLTAAWGQQVIVDNRPGGNNVIAAEALLRSNPDGHTILLITASHAINPWLFRDQPYDPIKDFAPVATLVSTEYILVVNPSVPAHTLKEFIAYARSRPGQLNAASSNTGGVQHLALEVFNALAGVKLHHVPYKGGGPGMTDLIGGHVQLAFNNAITVMPHVNSGKLRALGVGGDKRLALLPQLHTFAEAGLPGFNVKNWFGVVAPARTPRPVVGKLAAEIARVQALPDVKEKLGAHGAEIFPMGADAFGAYIKAEIAKYGRIIKAANIRIDS